MIRPETRQSLLFALAFALVALLLRVSTFGDPNIHVDEVFYQVVGIAMHEGAVPYVDIWDRKPWGLFFLFYLIAFLSWKPIAYQLVATAFAAATSWIIARTARRWCTAQGALFAGFAYLLWLDKLQGFGGQTPIFYNLFVASAALLALGARESLLEGRVPPRFLGAMLLGGLAITIKQTVVFEASFLGLYGAGLLLRSAMPRPRALAHIASWALIGAAPFVLISIWYAANGYWDIYWHAMVTSNADKPKSLISGAIRALIVFAYLAPLLMVATLSLANWSGPTRRFVAGWMVAALLGLVSVPNFYMHYALPMLVPLSLACASFLARPRWGIIAIVCLAGWSLSTAHVLNFEHTARSRAAMEKLASAIRRHDHGRGLFVVSGPPQLYVMTGNSFPTPLVFPQHLGDIIEKDLSHLSTIGETRRVLAGHPGTVVIMDNPKAGPPNMEVINATLAYVRANCRKVESVETLDLLNSPRMNVWAECRPASDPRLQQRR